MVFWLQTEAGGRLYICNRRSVHLVFASENNSLPPCCFMLSFHLARGNVWSRYVESQGSFSAISDAPGKSTASSVQLPRKPSVLESNESVCWNDSESDAREKGC